MRPDAKYAAELAADRLAADGAVVTARSPVGDAGVNIEVLVPSSVWKAVGRALDGEPWRYRIGGTGLWRRVPAVGYLWADGSQLLLQRRICPGLLPPWWFAPLEKRLWADAPRRAPADILLTAAVQALRPGAADRDARTRFVAGCSDAAVVRQARAAAAGCRLTGTLDRALAAAGDGRWSGVASRDGRASVARVLSAMSRRIRPTRIRAAVQADLRIGLAPVTVRIAGVETYSPPGSFVPTPDAETLVDTVIAELDGHKHTVAIDCGTGNGAIALGIARHRPRAEVVGVDPDRRAVRAARRAARRAELGNARFLPGSLLDPLPAWTRGRVDVLVANLPFYPPARRAAIGAVAEATIVGEDDDGLGLHRALLAAAGSYLSVEAVIVLQMFSEQWASFARELPRYGLQPAATISSGPFSICRAVRVPQPAGGTS